MGETMLSALWEAGSERCAEHTSIRGEPKLPWAIQGTKSINQPAFQVKNCMQGDDFVIIF